MTYSLPLIIKHMENAAVSTDASQPEDPRAVTTDRRNEIQEAVERLSLEKELAESIVNLTLQQLREAEAMGRLSSRELTRLEQKYSADLARVTKALQKHEQLLTLHELETTQQQLMHTFKAQLHDITQQIRQLKDAPQFTEHEVSDITEQVDDILFASLVPKALKIDTDNVNTAEIYSGSAERDHVEDSPPPAQNPSSSKWISILLVITIAVFLVSSASYTMGLLSATNSANMGTLIMPSDQLGVYVDSSCSQLVTAIDWGSLASGEQKTFAVFLRNVGNMSCVLQLDAMNWNPPYFSDHVIVSWDYEGHVLAVDDILPVVFTLAVSPDLENIGAFSYDLVITTFS